MPTSFSRTNQRWNASNLGFPTKPWKEIKKITSPNHIIVKLQTRDPQSHPQEGIYKLNLPHQQWEPENMRIKSSTNKGKIKSHQLRTVHQVKILFKSKDEKQISRQMRTKILSLTEAH